MTNKPVSGKIFYDHNLKLWTLLVYDENGNSLPTDESNYEYYKKDIKAKMKDYPTVEKWEIYKRSESK